MGPNRATTHLCHEHQLFSHWRNELGDADDAEHKIATNLRCKLCGSIAAPCELTINSNVVAMRLCHVQLPVGGPRRSAFECKRTSNAPLVVTSFEIFRCPPPQFRSSNAIGMLPPMVGGVSLPSYTNVSKHGEFAFGSADGCE